MDYQQHLYGHSPQNPARARGPVHREGGVGGIALVIGAVVGALGLVIWMAGERSAADIADRVPPATHQAVFPVATPASY